MENAIALQVKEALSQLQQQARLVPGDILVVGCSTSEVVGQTIGTASNAEVAQVIATQILGFCDRFSISPAFQCCEHLNRALVVESTVVRRFDLDDVTVLPHPNAGGALASAAMEMLTEPTVVETLAQKARAGIDIGNTLIGMHLRPVVIPVRIEVKRIGEAAVVCARTRPKLIGGSRAKYPNI